MVSAIRTCLMGGTIGGQEEIPIWSAVRSSQATPAHCMGISEPRSTQQSSTRRGPIRVSGMRPPYGVVPTPRPQWITRLRI